MKNLAERLPIPKSFLSTQEIRSLLGSLFGNRSTPAVPVLEARYDNAKPRNPDQVPLNVTGFYATALHLSKEDAQYLIAQIPVLFPGARLVPCEQDGHCIGFGFQVSPLDPSSIPHCEEIRDFLKERYPGVRIEFSAFAQLPQMS